MSKIADIKTQIKDIEYLKETLDELGLQYEEGGQVMGYEGSRKKVDLRLMGKQFENYGVGFVWQGETLAIRGDFDYGQGISNKKIRDQIIQKYPEVVTRAFARRKGYTVFEDRDTDGSVLLRLRKMA